MESLLSKYMRQNGHVVYRLVWCIVDYLRSRTEAHGADEILPGLFLGSQEAVEKNNWTHVLSLREKGISTPALPKHVSRYRIFIKDEENEPIHEHFFAATEWIHEARRQRDHRILIHCRGGYSRSPTLVAAYLIRYFQMNVDHALELINRWRQVQPNSGFFKQLVRYHSKLSSSFRRHSS